MTSAPTEPATPHPAERLFSSLAGAMDLIGVYLGEALGLYGVLAKADEPITASELARLRALTIAEDGSASSWSAALTLSVYEWRTGSWTVLGGPRTGAPWDRTVAASPPGAAADYVSPEGEVLVSVKGTRSGPFTLRTDLVHVTIQY